jgi:magnesium chelatase family protein
MESGAFAEDSRIVAERVAQAWEIRKEGEKDGPRDLERLRRQLTTGGNQWAINAYEQYRLTARGFFRMLSLARTIADLSGEEAIGPSALAEALEYRMNPIGI